MLSLFVLAIDLDVYAFGKWNILVSSYSQMNISNEEIQTFSINLEETPAKKQISGVLIDSNQEKIGKVFTSFKGDNEVLCKIPKLNFSHEFNFNQTNIPINSVGTFEGIDISYNAVIFSQTSFQITIFNSKTKQVRIISLKKDNPPQPFSLMNYLPTLFLIFWVISLCKKPKADPETNSNSPEQEKPKSD